MTSVNSPSSAIGIARGGKAPSRILPVEDDQLRAVGPQPRSDGAGGAETSPEVNPPRRRGRIRESGDVGGRGTPDREPELGSVESGKHLHQPDEGRTEFTMVPEVESLTRGSARSSPTSARREPADQDASYSTMQTSGADFQTRYAETQTILSNLTNTKQSTPGTFQAARAGINPAKDRQIDLGVDSEVQSTHLQSEVTDWSQFRPATQPMAPHRTTAKGLQTLLTATAEVVASPSQRSTFSVRPPRITA